MVQLDVILSVTGLVSCLTAVFYYIFIAIKAKWNQHCHQSACKPILWSLIGITIVLAVAATTAFWVLCFPFYHPVSGFICVAKANLLWEQWHGAAPQNLNTQLDTCSYRSHLPQTASATCESLLGMPKVALIFLIRDFLPHEELWRVWLASAAGLVNTKCIKGLPCQNLGREYWHQVQQACGNSHFNANQTVLQQQHMFSIYVHNWPNSTAFPPDSIFYNTEVVNRVPTEWGGHSLAEGSKRLLQAALADPLNQRFVMLSESALPLYPPATIYQQLMLEDKSRINACKLMFWKRQMNR